MIVSRDYTHSKDTANSVLHHKVRPEDHGKVVECRAESPALDGPLVTQVVLEVYCEFLMICNILLDKRTVW